VLEGCAFRVAVRVPSGNIEVVQHTSAFDEVIGHIRWQLAQEFGDYVPPRLLSQMEMQSLNCLFGRLMGRETRPFVRPLVSRLHCVLKVSLRLGEPVSSSIYQLSTPFLKVALLTEVIRSLRHVTLKSGFVVPLGNP
jgi:hypothetical protein